MENRNFQWENSPFLWSCSIEILVITRGCMNKMIRTFLEPCYPHVHMTRARTNIFLVASKTYSCVYILCNGRHAQTPMSERIKKTTLFGRSNHALSKQIILWPAFPTCVCQIPALIGCLSHCVFLEIYQFSFSAISSCVR